MDGLDPIKNKSVKDWHLEPLIAIHESTHKWEMNKQQQQLSQHRNHPRAQKAAAAPAVTAI